MSAHESLFDHGRVAQIRQLVTRWIALPDEQVGRLSAGLHYPIPASPDDVFWLCDQVERLAKAVQTADVAYSEAINDIGRDLVKTQERALAAEKAIRHVIDDSPGTPDSVKKYLLRELYGSWGDAYEEAMLSG